MTKKATAKRVSAASPTSGKAGVGPRAPWEIPGRELRFAGHRIALVGKFAALRKKEVAEVLAAEGATVTDKLGKDTTVFVCAAAGSTDHKRASKMASEGAPIAVVTEDEFRRRWLLPTADQASAMLAEAKKGRARLASLLELNRPPYMRSTDEFSTIRLEGQSFLGANLSNVSLCGLHFIECDLQETNLTKAKWIAEAEKTDFRKATAKECELVEVRECDFREAELGEASLRDLQGCRFDGANLTKAHGSDGLRGCRFDGATLGGFSASYVEITECSFEKATLAKAKFVQAEIEDCRFTGADLRGATFQGDSDPVVFKNCDLRAADFRGATLSHVRFEACDLTGARFEDAKLAEIELVGTDGSKASGLEAPRAAKANAKGPAFEELEAAAPTFKNITVTVMLKVGGKKVECMLYQFDHSANTSCRQAWLGGKEVGSLTLADAIATIAKLKPGAAIDDKTLVVKSTKGKVTPRLKPKGLEEAIRNAWHEALA